MALFGVVRRLYGREAGSRTLYMTRIKALPKLFGHRLMVHVFHRGDEDVSPHDHPFAFWTFPLTSYVEQVFDTNTGRYRFQIVPRFRWSFRQAEHLHRVIGPASGFAQHLLDWLNDSASLSQVNLSEADQLHPLTANTVAHLCIRHELMEEHLRKIPAMHTTFITVVWHAREFRTWFFHVFKGVGEKMLSVRWKHYVQASKFQKEDNGWE